MHSAGVQKLADDIAGKHGEAVEKVKRDEGTVNREQGTGSRE